MEAFLLYWLAWFRVGMMATDIAFKFHKANLDQLRREYDATISRRV